MLARLMILNGAQGRLSRLHYEGDSPSALTAFFWIRHGAKQRPDVHRATEFGGLSSPKKWGWTVPGASFLSAKLPCSTIPHEKPN